MATTITKTIRASGGDYTSITAWEAAEQGDLVTLDQIKVGECYNDWPTGKVETVTIDGSTTDSTRYMILTVASGHGHNGIPKSGFYLTNSVAFGATLTTNDNYIKIIGLDVENTSVNGDAIRQGGSESSVSIINTIVKGGRAGVNNLRVSVTLANCLAYSSGTGFYCGTFQTPKIYNCVAANNTTGFNLADGSGDDIRNCVAYNNTTNYTGSFAAASTNNASSSATDDAPGANSVWNITSADFVDATNLNFHLSSGSALRGAGTNLYSVFTTDIDGDALPSSGAWDIGFDYYVAPLGAPTLSSPLATSITANSIIPQVTLTFA